jgi:hypothetical protein
MPLPTKPKKGIAAGINVDWTTTAKIQHVLALPPFPVAATVGGAESMLEESFSKDQEMMASIGLKLKPLLLLNVRVCVYD